MAMICCVSDAFAMREACSRDIPSWRAVEAMPLAGGYGFFDVDAPGVCRCQLFPVHIPLIGGAEASVK
jgi:hypothetical protein